MHLNKGVENLIQLAPSHYETSLSSLTSNDETQEEVTMGKISISSVHLGREGGLVFAKAAKEAHTEEVKV